MRMRREKGCHFTTQTLTLHNRGQHDHHDNGPYRGHSVDMMGWGGENMGPDLSTRILTRLGESKDFILKWNLIM